MYTLLYRLCCFDNIHHARGRHPHTQIPINRDKQPTTICINALQRNSPNTTAHNAVNNQQNTHAHALVMPSKQTHKQHTSRGGVRRVSLAGCSRHGRRRRRRSWSRFIQQLAALITCHSAAFTPHCFVGFFSAARQSRKYIVDMIFMTFGPQQTNRTVQGLRSDDMRVACLLCCSHIVGRRTKKESTAREHERWMRNCCVLRVLPTG